MIRYTRSLQHQAHQLHQARHNKHTSCWERLPREIIQSIVSFGDIRSYYCTRAISRQWVNIRAIDCHGFMMRERDFPLDWQTDTEEGRVDGNPNWWVYRFEDLRPRRLEVTRSSGVGKPQLTICVNGRFPVLCLRELVAVENIHYPEIRCCRNLTSLTIPMDYLPCPPNLPCEIMRECLLKLLHLHVTPPWKNGVPIHVDFLGETWSHSFVETIATSCPASLTSLVVDVPSSEWGSDDMNMFRRNTKWEELAEPFAKIQQLDVTIDLPCDKVCRKLWTTWPTLTSLTIRHRTGIIRATTSLSQLDIINITITSHDGIADTVLLALGIPLIAHKVVTYSLNQTVDQPTKNDDTCDNRMIYDLRVALSALAIGSR